MTKPGMTLHDITERYHLVGPDWSPGNRSSVVEVIEGTSEAVIEYARSGYGQSLNLITEDEIKALRDGKAIAFDDGEYTHVIVYWNGKP